MISKPKMQLSVVIPIYNEEQSLREIVDKVLATPYEKESILLDDCSKDNSRGVMAELEEEHAGSILCCCQEQNLGKGAFSAIVRASLFGKPGPKK